MKRHNLLLALAAIPVAALALWYAPQMRHQARADSLPNLLELAPADSTVIAYADLATLRNSPLVQHLASMAQPTSVDKDYADFMRSTGFDYQRDLDRMIFASRPAPSTQTLVFAEGRFDHARIEQYALRSGNLENQNGHPVYVMPSGAAGKHVSIAFLADNRIDLSDGGDLSIVFAPHSESQLDPMLRERVSRVAGSPLFAVAKTPPSPAANSSGPGQAPAPAVPMSAPFASLRWVNFAARPDGSAVLLSVEGECSDPEAAQKIATSLEFVRGMVHGGLADPKSRGQMKPETAAAADRLLQAVRVTTEAERVRMLLTITPDMLSAPASPTGAVRQHPREPATEGH
jgi:hypothetical protein